MSAASASTEYTTKLPLGSRVSNEMTGYLLLKELGETAGRQVALCFVNRFTDVHHMKFDAENRMAFPSGRGGS